MEALIVDDDTDIPDVARLSLELVSGWTVFDAHCGLDAIELAMRRQPDVILLDVTMPGMDGVETLRRLSEDAGTRNIPVIFLTAVAQTRYRERLEAAGARGLIAKPFDPLTLADEIEMILAVPSSTGCYGC